jgi:nucleotide-binding universal stress UspA family protein
VAPLNPRSREHRSSTGGFKNLCTSCAGNTANDCRSGSGVAAFLSELCLWSTGNALSAECESCLRLLSNDRPGHDLSGVQKIQGSAENEEYPCCSPFLGRARPNHVHGSENGSDFRGEDLAVHCVRNIAAGNRLGGSEDRDVLDSDAVDDFSNVESRLTQLVSGLRQQGLNSESLLVQGAPAVEIVSIAERYGIDVMIVGSHGHSAFYELFVGSVSERVIYLATCPVSVVPGKTSGLVSRGAGRSRENRWHLHFEPSGDTYDHDEPRFNDRCSLRRV